MTEKLHTGGCLCGALRYQADGDPFGAGYCCCADCRRASGSGFIPYMAFPSSAVRFTGQTRQFRSKSFRGTTTVRNSCPACSSLVFGGEVGEAEYFTIYAGSLDDPTLFQPRVAIFVRDRPAWLELPPGLEVFETLPA